MHSLASDLLAVTDAIGASTSKPIFWLAISMGGAVVSRALQMQPDAVAGVVLLAPMISLTKVCGGSVLRWLIAADLHMLAFTLALNLTLALALIRCVKNTLCQRWGSATATFSL